MKRIIVTIVLAAGVLGNTTSAHASTLSVGDAYYLGFVDTITPASPADMLSQVNYLTTLGAGEVAAAVTVTGNDGHAFTFSRAGSTLTGSPPTADLTGYLRGGSDTISDVSGFTYVVAKYGTVGHVWALSQLSGTIQLPSAGLSNVTLFQASPQDEHPPDPVDPHDPPTDPQDPHPVPDGGTTLGLLGLAMLGLGVLRRRLT